MSVEVEKLENNMAKLTIEIPADEFTAALDKAYQADKHRFSVPGFRKGKAPRRMIQKLYGAGIFYEDAANYAIQTAYPDAVKESGETIVSRPTVSIEQIEEGMPLIFTAEVALKPDVTLGEYKGIEVERIPVEISDEEIDAQIETEREQNARMLDVDDRPVQNGDLVKLDFEGFIDGKAFEGGKGSDYPLTVGSGSFIPGFEEQLIDKNIGEDFEVKVTFPEDYQAEDLKGKDAVFQCRINGISYKELPELDDEFAQDVSEFDTLEEYRDDIRSHLFERKQEDARHTKQGRVLEKVVENAAMEIPQPMIDEETSHLTDELAANLQSQGMSIDQYMQYTGTTAEMLTDQMNAQALRRIQNSLVLEAIAEAENIEISDEQVDEEIQKMADSYRMDFEELKGKLDPYEIDQMRDDLLVQTAADLITDSAVEVDAAEPEEDKADTLSEANSEK